jgi:hypothetical protein
MDADQLQAAGLLEGVDDEAAREQRVDLLRHPNRNVALVDVATASA